MPKTAGYVLAGGKSSRFGRDKALIDWHGKPLVLHVASTVAQAAGSATLVGSPEKYAHLGLRVIPDSLENFGPLAGLLAALEDSNSSWNLVTACDTPYLTVDFLRFLLSEAERVNADILLPLGPNGLPEPLCAVYSIDAREAIRVATKRGVRKMTRAFEGLQVHNLPYDEYAAFDPDGKLLTNLNRPEDLPASGPDPGGPL